MAHSSRSSDPPLDDDLELQEFRDILPFALEGLESESPIQTYEEAVKMIQQLIGQDYEKLIAMIDFIHDATIIKGTWTTFMAVNFYRIAFETLALDLMICKESSSSRTISANVVMSAIVEKCIYEVESRPDWKSASVSNVLEFVDVGFILVPQSVSAPWVGEVIVRMYQSDYLLFGQNLDTFQEFALRLAPHLDRLVSVQLGARISNAAQRVHRWKEEGASLETRATQHMLDPFISPQESCPTTVTSNINVPRPQVPTKNHAGIADPALDSSNRQSMAPRASFEALSAEEKAAITSLYQSVDMAAEDTDDETDVDSFREFNFESNWGCQAVQCIIDRMQTVVKIGASQKKLEAAYIVIRSMVKSDMVFREKNLLTLASVLLRVGPVLDAMAGPKRSTRLTGLLKALKQNHSECTETQEREIDAVCWHLGRDPSGVPRPVVRDDEEGGVSLLI